MKITANLVLAAVLSLSIGIAAAAPLMISELNIVPYPRLPDGPKADTGISVVYADFSISPGKEFVKGISEETSILNYEVILNVTNLSEFGSEVTRLGITAAQDIYASPAAVGFMDSVVQSSQAGGGSISHSASDDVVPGTEWSIWSSYKNGVTLAGGSGLVTGVWLDGAWVNVTWVPGTDYPAWPTPSGGWFTENSTLKASSFSDTWPTTKTVPSLPQNATTEGTWIEGVPIIEMHNITTTQGKTLGVNTTTAIFVNGTWVDVTGRVTTQHQEEFVRATNTIAGERRYFDTEAPINLTNATDSETQSYPRKAWTPFVTFTQTGQDQFDNYWAPHESRLILLKGTREFQPGLGINSLSTGQITLLAEQFNHVQDPAVNNTAVYTYSGGSWLSQVPLQQTTNGYIYNALGDQKFVTDQFGVEVFLQPRS